MDPKLCTVMVTLISWFRLYGAKYGDKYGDNSITLQKRLIKSKNFRCVETTSQRLRNYFWVEAALQLKLKLSTTTSLAVKYIAVYKDRFAVYGFQNVISRWNLISVCVPSKPHVLLVHLKAWRIIKQLIKTLQMKGLFKVAIKQPTLCTL